MLRTNDNYTDRYVPEELQERLWEIYDEGYDYGITSQSNDIDVTWDGEYTTINMKQNDPYRVKIIKDKKDYHIKKDIHLNIFKSEFRDIELMNIQDLSLKDL